MNKLFFTLILILCHYLSFSQDYIGITKDQIISMKGYSYEEKNEGDYNFLYYKVPSLTGNEPGKEVFTFDKNNTVVGFYCIKDIRKMDLVNLIRYNNGIYQTHNSGVKGEMQWVDLKNRIEISLKTVEFTDNVSMLIYRMTKMK